MKEIIRQTIFSIGTDEKKIAITFDAAWSAEDTDELIEILKKHNAKATIFAVGDWVEKNPEAVITLTNDKVIKIELCYDVAPNAVTNFIAFAREKVASRSILYQQRIRCV